MGLLNILKGFNHPNAKLTKYDVADIKQRSNFGISQMKIANHYGVCQKTISNVINGKRYFI